MADDEMPQSRRRLSRVITALILAVGVVAGALALRLFLTTRPRPEPTLGPVFQLPPALFAPTAPPTRSEARSGPLVDEVSAASGTGKAVEPDYEEWTVATLRTHARELGITGYSRMRKAELIATLRGAAG